MDLAIDIAPLMKCGNENLLIRIKHLMKHSKQKTKLEIRKLGTRSRLSIGM